MSDGFMRRNSGKIIGIGITTLTVGSAIGVGFLSASFSKNSPNQISILRNKISGNIRTTEKHGIFMVSPFETAMRMSTTQVEHQFGNEDKDQTDIGYFPINAGQGQELAIAVNVKWQADIDNQAQAIEDIYGWTGSTSISNKTIVSQIKNTISRAAQDYVNAASNSGQTITVPELIGQKTELANSIKDQVLMILAEHHITLNQLTITDMVPNDSAKVAIDKITQSATLIQVAHNNELVRQAELQVSIAQQQIDAQEAFNKIMGNQFILTALVSDGIDANDITDLSKLSAAVNASSNLSGTLQELLQKGEFFNNWDGKLPTTLLGQTGIEKIITG